MERSFLWLLLSFKTKLHLFTDSIVLFPFGNIYNTVDKFKSDNYFNYCTSIPEILHQSETKRIPNLRFKKSEHECISGSDTLEIFEIKNNTPISFIVISKGITNDLWNYYSETRLKTLVQKFDKTFINRIHFMACVCQ